MLPFPLKVNPQPFYTIMVSPDQSALHQSQLTGPPSRAARPGLADSPTVWAGITIPSRWIRAPFGPRSRLFKSNQAIFYTANDSTSADSAPPFSRHAGRGGPSCQIVPNRVIFPRSNPKQGQIPGQTRLIFCKLLKIKDAVFGLVALLCLGSTRAPACGGRRPRRPHLFLAGILMRLPWARSTFPFTIRQTWAILPPFIYAIGQ
jgi:hypothetical protein